MKKLFTLIAFLSMVMGANAAWVVSGAGAILNGETWNHTSSTNTMTQQGNGTWQLTVTDAVLEVGTAYEWLVTDGTHWIKDGSSNYKITVDQTAKYKIVYTLAADAQSASAVVTKTGEAGPVTHTYTVAGVSALMGSEWDPADTNNDMTAKGDGTYELVKTNLTLPAAAYTYKVAIDHSWGEAYPSSDAILTIDESGVYDVTFTFNTSNKQVGANATKKGNADIEETMVVVGDNATLFGVTWDTAKEAIAVEANKMTKLANGNWEKVYTGVDLPACTIQWKLVHNGVTWIPDNNQELVLEEPGIYTITFTYIVEDQEPQAQAQKTGESEGVKGVTIVSTDTQKMYDLQGRRVMNAQKGLYIVNGKKLICR